MNAGDGSLFRRGPGERLSPGLLVACLLLCCFALADRASRAEAVPGFLAADDGATLSGPAAPLLRILYAANSRGALHPCPS